MPFARTILLSLLLLAFAASLSAQVVPSDSLHVQAFASAGTLDEDSEPAIEYRLGEITVAACRIRVEVASSPQRVSVLDRGAIQQSGARHPTYLLASRSGLFIRQYGEGPATVSLRGAGPSLARILLDGMRLADPQLGQLDLSFFRTYVLSAVMEVAHPCARAASVRWWRIGRRFSLYQSAKPK